MYTRGNSDEVRAAFERGLALAEGLGERRHLLFLLTGRNIFMARRGDFRGMLEDAKRSLDVAQNIGNDHDIAMADWLLGNSYHLLGDQEKAQYKIGHRCDARHDVKPVWASAPSST
jgi:tetratricopeptide (TPR) repeat protein